MTPRSALSILLALLGCAAAAAHAQLAQEPEEAPWLQLEVVVFRNLDAALAGDEQWPAAPELGYPDELHFLLEPGSEAESAARAELEFDAALRAEEGQQDAGPPPVELPWTKLGAEASFLADAASRIAGSSAYRLLLHEAWRQPAPESGQPLRVLLTGGTQAGAHFELEGFLSLERARFLHLGAMLWLNEFGAPGELPPGAGQVVLPEVPQPPPPPRFEPLPGIPEDTGGVPALPAEPAADIAVATDASVVPAPAEEIEALADPLDGTPTIEAEPVPVLRSVVLQGSRRVSPGEYVYLDHPLFGLLFSMRPYAPPEPSAAGDDAAGAAAAD